MKSIYFLLLHSRNHKLETSVGSILSNLFDKNIYRRLVPQSVVLGCALVTISIHAQISEPILLVSSDSDIFKWNGFYWGQSWESIKSKLPIDNKYYIYDEEIKNPNINDTTIKSYSMFNVKYNNKSLTVSFYFYGIKEQLKQIKVSKGEYLFNEDPSGENRERGREQQRQFSNTVVNLFNNNFEYGDDLLKKFSADKSGRHIRAWTVKDTLVELSYTDYGVDIKKNQKIASVDITYTTINIAKQNKYYIPVKPQYDEIRLKGITIPAGTTANAKLDISPEEAPNNAEWNCVVETTSPFYEDNGTAHGPERLRFLIKMKPGTGHGSSQNANWYRKIGDSNLEYYRGSGLATIDFKKSIDGSIKKSDNRESKLTINNTFILKYYDSQVELQKNVLEKTRNEAEAGNTKSMILMGFYYSIGYYVVQDEDAAMEWYLKAARLGSGEAMNSIGEFYLLKKHYSNALEWYNKAAKAGYYFAHHPLAIIYYLGYGQPKDSSKAFEHFQIAALHGTVASMKSLGILYSQGDGVPKSDLLAYAWLSLAAAEDKSVVSLRDSAEGILTPDQKAQGQSLAQNLFATIAENRKKEKSK